MSKDVPVQVIVAAFDDEHGAEKALQELKEARKEKLIGIQDAAILWRDAGGKLHIKETADMRGGKGAVIGGVVGAVAGVLAGPPSRTTPSPRQDVLADAVWGITCPQQDSIPQMASVWS